LAIERDRSAMLKKESEEEIQNQRTNALNSLKCASLGEMAKNISHEINGPLAVILGSVHQMNRIMDQESTNTEKLKIYTARLDRSVIRIEKIVKGLHSITRETSDDPFIHVQINSVIDEALSFFHERFLSHNIKINLSGDLEAIFECRNTQITQVLVSLLNNSFEAIVGSENPWIQVDTALFGNNIRIEITDSGPGISSEIAEKIMIPLFTTKVLAKATGLGLSISQAFVEEHSGKIWYDQKCQHTRFVIELPIEQMPSLKQVA
ncbi:MAG: HAMP domain-containing sensor histidine kinase, partial [Bacteriovorax sp.]|nr:HAMP domain-containing sensor histidine kinase [Bacteriovorax sp.]